MNNCPTCCRPMRDGELSKDVLKLKKLMKKYDLKKAASHENHRANTAFL